MLYADLIRALRRAEHAAAIDLSSDDAVLTPPADRLYVGVAGDVRVETLGGETVTFAHVPVGYLEIACVKVVRTGTTAQDLVALWIQSDG
jgi:hypothetical protein